MSTNAAHFSAQPKQRHIFLSCFRSPVARRTKLKMLPSHRTASTLTITISTVIWVSKIIEDKYMFFRVFGGLSHLEVVYSDRTDEKRQTHLSMAFTTDFECNMYYSM